MQNNDRKFGSPIFQNKISQIVSKDDFSYIIHR